MVLHLYFSVASISSSAALTPCPSPKLWFYGQDYGSHRCAQLAREPWLCGWAPGWGGGQPPSSELGQPRGVKAAGLKDSGLPAGLKVGLSMQALIFFGFLVTGLWIYQLNHWMGFAGGCRDASVLGSPSCAGNATTVAGVRASWAWAPDPSLCGANALLRLKLRILNTNEIGWWSISSAVYFDIEFVIQGLHTVYSRLTAGCYFLPGWLLGAGLSGEGCMAEREVLAFP